MESSILISTKQALGIPESMEAFDHEVLLYINAAFSAINQLGVGPIGGVSIIDATTKWEDHFPAAEPSTNLVKSYVALKTKLAFDPPATSFGINAVKDQVEEQTWRLHTFANKKESLEPWVSESTSTT